ncbi:MAG: DUF3106 domain-containing protein [bacterium]
MKRAWRQLAALVLVVGFFATPAFAQRGPTLDDYQRRLERWQTFSPVDRQRLIQIWREYQGLPGDEKLEFDRRWNQWQDMNEEKRSHIRRKYHQFRELPPRERRSIIEQQRPLFRPPVVIPPRNPIVPRNRSFNQPRRPSVFPPRYR